MSDWAGDHIGLHFIPPGESWRNGYIESFNARIRDECLNINVFWSLTQARIVIADWKEEYNYHRRHSALGYQARPATQPSAPIDERQIRRPGSFRLHQVWRSRSIPTGATAVLHCGRRKRPHAVDSSRKRRRGGEHLFAARRVERLSTAGRRVTNTFVGTPSEPIVWVNANDRRVERDEDGTYVIRID